MFMGAAMTDVLASISHASTPITRRQRERAKWRNEIIIREE
jgi:hypothetical protein